MFMLLALFVLADDLDPALDGRHGGVGLHLADDRIQPIQVGREVGLLASGGAGYELASDLVVIRPRAITSRVPRDGKGMFGAPAASGTGYPSM